MPIAVVEHHRLLSPNLSPLDICKRLETLWYEIRQEAEMRAFTLQPESIVDINKRVSSVLDIGDCIFLDREGWLNFIKDLPNIEDDPSHICSWIFSTLYWNHLVQCRLATAWFFVNAIRIQNALPEYRLSLSRIGEFLDSLSRAGPPLFDGQTFYPEHYFLPNPFERTR
jgi:hypothetical protein